MTSCRLLVDGYLKPDLQYMLSLRVCNKLMVFSFWKYPEAELAVGSNDCHGLVGS